MVKVNPRTIKRPACGAWLTLEQLAKQTHPLRQSKGATRQRTSRPSATIPLSGRRSFVNVKPIALLQPQSGTYSKNRLSDIALRWDSFRQPISIYDSLVAPPPARSSPPRPPTYPRPGRGRWYFPPCLRRRSPERQGRTRRTGGKAGAVRRPPPPESPRDVFYEGRGLLRQLFRGGGCFLGGLCPLFRGLFCGLPCLFGVLPFQLLPVPVAGGGVFGKLRVFLGHNTELIIGPGLNELCLGFADGPGAPGCAF